EPPSNNQDGWAPSWTAESATCGAVARIQMVAMTCGSGVGVCLIGMVSNIISFGWPPSCMLSLTIFALQGRERWE
ncbi:MAG TPA: hypothetical protein VD789_01940, partial [Thermomicrobiales bacterium]|nr:hypothetical protein [Thermomicrobiales bacterium]